MHFPDYCKLFRIAALMLWDRVTPIPNAKYSPLICKLYSIFKWCSFSPYLKIIIVINKMRISMLERVLVGGNIIWPDTIFLFYLNREMIIRISNTYVFSLIVKVALRQRNSKTVVTTYTDIEIHRCTLLLVSFLLMLNIVLLFLRYLLGGREMIHKKVELSIFK